MYKAYLKTCGSKSCKWHHCQDCPTNHSYVENLSDYINFIAAVLGTQSTWEPLRSSTTPYNKPKHASMRMWYNQILLLYERSYGEPSPYSNFSPSYIIWEEDEEITFNEPLSFTWNI